MSGAGSVSAARFCAVVALSGALLACSGAAATDVTGTTVKTGTLSVTITGLADSATAGGSVAVTRTDGSAQAPLAIVIANAGSAGASAKTQLSVGTYSVVYAAPSGYLLAAGVSNVQEAIIGRAGDSVGVTFAVAATAPPPAPASYDGAWSGTTADGGPISFTITGTVVSDVSVTFRLTGDCGLAGVTVTVLGKVGVVSGQTLSAGDSTSAMQLSGSFTSFTQATGSASTVYSGVFPSGATCRSTGSSTWVARH